ncbi:unnamed protein product, partial [Ceratitis capitata]
GACIWRAMLHYDIVTRWQQRLKYARECKFIFINVNININISYQQMGGGAHELRMDECCHKVINVHLLFFSLTTDRSIDIEKSTASHPP